MKEEKLIAKPFLDWYGIWASHRKIEKDGSIWSQDPPLGVRLVVQPAKKSEVFFEKEYPWEIGSNLGINTIIHENGVYRLWYGAGKVGDISRNYICYAESKDGFNWNRPELGIVEYEGSKKNNILYGGEKRRLGSIFVDPSAPADERYKAIAAQGTYYRNGKLDPTMNMKKFKELMIAMDLGEVSPEDKEKSVELHLIVGGSVSHDGINWRHLDKPILDVGRTQLDTHNLCTYDPYTKKYVAYLRGHLERRRLIRRAEGKEFCNLQDPVPCLMCDPQDPIDDDIYNPCYCPYPGRELYIMFPSFYHRIDSTVDIQFAVSHDSFNWSRPERKPIISLEHQNGKYGCIYASPNLIVLDDGEWRLPYIGFNNKHDFRQRGEKYPEDGEFRWASWLEDRLVGLEASEEGRVTLIQRECRGKEMRINFCTEKDGWIKVELVNPPGTPPKEVNAISGYSKEETEPLTGDELSKAVKWNGKSNLASLKGKDISVRIHMFKAKIFSTAL